MSERPVILMQRRGTFLVPEAPMDSEALSRYPSGARLRVTVTQPRSIQQHRLYWAMLALVVDNLDQPVTAEALHEWVKLKLGHVSQIKLRSGEIVEVPASVAFDKMDQAAFRDFFDRAVTLLTEHVIPGLRKADLEREARLMLGQ